MTRLFGTDGVRGIANADLTCEIAYHLGRAAVEFLGKSIVVGKDTRKSGDMLEAAVSAGIMSKGGNALSAGIIPTPGVAFLVNELHCDGGIVISASHNPPEYNGIKLFDGQGFKLSDEIEDAVDAYVRQSCGMIDPAADEPSGAQPTEEVPVGDGVGVLIPIEEAAQVYIGHVVDSIAAQGVRFDGLHVALDVGHGASALTSEEALSRLGAKVTVINEDFDGNDINVECGSTHLGPLRALVAESGADVGIAHDGDADRVMIVDRYGKEIDGDAIEAVCAIDMAKRGMLPGNTVASTIMCNIGFVRTMRDAGIEVVQTQVGDRFVLQAMRDKGIMLGGEQSGHIIFLEHNTTGDGLVAACQFLAACERANMSVEEAGSVMVRYPQVLINVAVADKHALEGNAVIAAAVAQAESDLGENGRVLVRPSGTEPIVRVMVEASDEETAQRITDGVASVVARELG